LTQENGRHWIKKDFLVEAGHCLLHVDLTELAAAEESSLIDAKAKNRRFCFEFQSTLLMRTNRQIDGAEWLPMDQKRLSPFVSGISFSMLTSRACRKPSLRINDFVEFQEFF
jgi:hypothetical protein